MAYDREIPEALDRLRAGLERRHEVGRQLIGLTVKEAREVATRSRCTLRLVRLNGKGLIVTADLDMNRVNVSVEDGIVVDASRCMSLSTRSYGWSQCIPASTERGIPVGGVRPGSP